MAGGGPGAVDTGFSNLLVNAAKYTDAGGRIYLGASVDGGKVTVRIRDNGVGIAREMLPRLFVPFFQGDALTWRAEGGLGVGLSLVRGLVTLHGGTIEAFSEGANKGSEFVVQLPAGGTPPAQPVRIKRDAQELPPARALRVLLVDDNRDAADTCATLLELAGQEVRVAHSGRGALEIAETFDPQVVVLDIGLPDVDGYEVARLLRGAEWGKNTVLVAATGWGREDDKQRAFAAGFNHHLTKPIAGDELLALLRSLSESRAD